MAQEFEKARLRPEFFMPDPMPFPEDGLPEARVLDGVRERIRMNPYQVEKNFGVSYVGPPHPIARRAADLAPGTFFVEWARETQAGTYQLEKEAVRMMASLLGNPEGVGFITTGGTESNMSAMRLARNLSGVSEPEMIMPQSGHYSFRVASELLGIKLREVPVLDNYRPDMDEVERLINRKTIGLICSAPEGSFGLLDPVEEFADLAERKGLFLHVDGAFGGFILPFMRELGRDVPPFDFSLPGVSTFMTDGHKLGLLPVATSFFLVRDKEMLDAIPTERTVIHNFTATKPGGHAAAAWAVMRHLGKKGYMESTRRVLEVVDLVSRGIEEIEGMRLVVKPYITVVNFTSDVYDVHKIYQQMRSRGWGTTYGVHRGVPRMRLSIHPHRDLEHARQFVRALEDSVDAVRKQG